MKMKKKRETALNYTVIYRAEPEGGYTVLVPALPGCVSYAKTLKKARKMAAEAIQLYVDCLVADGETVPLDGAVCVEKIAASI